MAEGRSFSKQFVPNFLMNVVSVIISTVVGLLLVPYFIDELGIAAYGIVPLATTVTSYVILISDSLSAAVSRYLSVAFQSSDTENAKRTYNTAVFGILKVVITLIPVVVLVAFMSPYMFDTGGSDPLSVQILFLCILASMLIYSWGYNFATVLFANNRLDQYNLVKITQTLVQVGMIVSLFNIASPSLVSIGVAYLVASIIAVLVAYALSRRNSPDVRLNVKEYDREYFKEICNVGGWSLVNSIGNLLFIQISMILTNLFLGAELGGEFAIVASMVSILVSVAGTISTAFTPITYNNFSNGRTDNMVYVCKAAMKTIGIFMAMPLAFICVFSPEILTVWVGEGLAHLSEVVFLMLFLLTGFQAVAPLYPISMAYMKVRAIGISTLVFGVMNIVITYAMVIFTDLGLIGIAISWSFTMFLKNCIFAPWYHAKIVGIKVREFYLPLIPGFICFIATSLLLIGVNHFIPLPASWTALILSAISVFIVYILVTPRLTLERKERDLLRSCLPEFISRRLPRWFL